MKHVNRSTAFNTLPQFLQRRRTGFRRVGFSKLSLNAGRCRRLGIPNKVTFASHACNIPRGTHPNETGRCFRGSIRAGREVGRIRTSSGGSSSSCGSIQLRSPAWFSSSSSLKFWSPLKSEIRNRSRMDQLTAHFNGGLRAWAAMCFRRDCPKRNPRSDCMSPTGPRIPYCTSASEASISVMDCREFLFFAFVSIVSLCEGRSWFGLLCCWSHGGHVLVESAACSRS